MRKSFGTMGCHGLHGTRRDRHCELARVKDLHRNVNMFGQVAGGNKSDLPKREGKWKTLGKQSDQSRVTALP